MSPIDAMICNTSVRTSACAFGVPRATLGRVLGWQSSNNSS